MILQNYLDKTNDIRKVAVISIFVNGFVNEEETKDMKTTSFNLFKKQYEDILDKFDM